MRFSVANRVAHAWKDDRGLQWHLSRPNHPEFGRKRML
jgi:hypothetical protein